MFALLPSTLSVSTANYNTNCSPASPSKLSSCKSGDLSGKFGAFIGSTSVDTSFTDSSISLFGNFSIIGRAVVLESSGVCLACSNINYQSTVRTLRATFNGTTGPISGSITLKQLSSTSPIFILVDLFKTDNTASLNHNWHIHDLSLASTGSCAATGGHYNPLSALSGTPATYASVCTPSTPEGCELGDLSGKFTKLNFTASNTTHTRLYFVDTTSLSLFGTYPAVNRAIVIHAENAGSTRIACADLVEVRPLVAIARFPPETLGGNITFTQSSPSEPVVISVSLSNTVTVDSGSSSWQINEFGVDIGCSPISVGNTLNPFNVSASEMSSLCDVSKTSRFNKCALGDLTGRLGRPTSYSAEVVDPTLSLFGRFSVLGRSIGFSTTSTTKYCSTIELDTAGMNVYIAKFTGSPVLGQIVFSQPADNPNAGTVVFANLWRSDGISTYKHNWHVHINPVNGTDCASTLGHYNPFAVSTAAATYAASCSPSTPEGCELGDLAGKHAPLSLLLFRRLSLLLETDFNLPLSGPNSILGRSVVIHDQNGGSARIACANIVRKPDLEARAVFIGPSGVSGVISFTQSSPNAPTRISVDLKGIDSQPNNTLLYHVHDFEATGGDCSAAITGGHFDPLQARASATYAADCNPSSGSRFRSCEVGDLSGKFGALPYEPFTVNDPSLSLYGKQSIYGRSVVIHFANATRWVCATIYPVNDNVRVVRGVFKGSVEGSVTFRQLEDQPDAFTTVYLQIRKPGALTPTHHNWHVHVAFVDGDTAAACAETGGHYNPYNVNTTRGPGPYDSCSADDPYSCELGDLSTRFGQLTLNDTWSKLMFVDYFLPLSGPVSIEGRSVVVHDAVSPLTRIACASLSIVSPRRVVATFDGVSTGGVKGTITLYQQSITEPTFVDVQLNGLYITPPPHNFHVHSFPLDASVPLESRCTSISAGGHYSPLPTNVSAPYATECNPSYSQRFTSCEVGDISGKLGKLTGNYFSGWDYNLPLFGRFSVAGRSIVIHRSTGEVWACATLSYPNEQPVTTYVANFTDSSNVFTGSIIITQPFNNSDAESTILVKLAYKDGAASSSSHNFHVHVNAVSGNPLTNSTACDSTLGHYNPTGAVVGAANYSTLCTPSSVKGCELGDLANKHSTLSFAAGSVATKVMFTDTWLPLSGAYSVANRSIVIHAANRGSARVACASLVDANPVVVPPPGPPGGGQTPNSSGSSDNSGAIAGGIIGTFLGIVLLAVLFAFVRRRLNGGHGPIRTHSKEILNDEEDRYESHSPSTEHKGIQMKSME